MTSGKGMMRHQSVAADDIITDEKLVARVATGDRHAFAMLVMRHADRFLALAERLLGDRAEAEDALQDAFAKLWTRADGFDPGRARFSTWFYRVVANAATDRLRRRRGTQSLPDGWDQADGRPAADQTLADGQRALRVAAAVAALPERQRLALTLSYYEGLNNREAASIMELSVKALESLLVRARRQLRGDLAPEIEQ